MKILIIGGTHGDERTGVDVVSRLRRKPVAGVDVLIANPRATKAGLRFIETDLNRSFGRENPQSYEEKRAVTIASVLRRYDFVLEFHNTTSRTTCGIVTNEFPTSQQLAVLEHFNVRYLVIMSPGRSLIGRVPSRAVSLEISIRNRKLCVEFLIEKIKTMACEKFVPAVSVKVYRDRGIKVTVAQLTALGLDLNHFKDFRPIRKERAGLLDLKHPCIPFLVDEKAYGESFAFRVAEKVKGQREGESWK